ncbi:hypothetical protein M378DRAFT_184496 [Amanita muscaria Koide BX008]|uniref:ubiquitinyl hydrolase 1 n=1 Tax=Amanita muscaria (strain Koide BX008) TaxID=946122 RepID=A0A0C2XJR1_AMAMK|nr:hypothetical protein M378DRAFT_184496 [Amanita muscaria Koide BX008]
MESANVLPSPASSPSPTTLEISAQPSRKRQRSHSLLSESSTSSFKRAVSEDVPSDIRSPPSRDPHQDIDAYMAEQGEADILTTVTFLPPSAPNATSYQPLPTDEKFSIVMKGKKREMEIGETWYLISRGWWRRWEKACTGQVDKDGPVSEQELGPVNNASLLDQYGHLRLPLIEGVDAEYAPEETWQLLVSWYGAPDHTLPRQVVGRGEAKQASLELYPPHFQVARLVHEGSQSPPATAPYPPVILSSGESVATLHGKLADVVLPNTQNRPIFRVWCLEQALDRSFDSPQVTSQFLSEKSRIFQPTNVTLEEAGIQTGDSFVVEFTDERGAWIMDTTGSSKPKDEPLFNSQEGFFNRMSSSTYGTRHTSQQTMMKALGTIAPRPSTHSAAFRKIEPGTVGLVNMGNTCFMNSALQCLAHNQELTEYFLGGVYEEELNPDNPLGMHGAIAQTFGALLQKIWNPTGTSSSYAPREFKQQLQRFAPQFIGYQQQDSQELVAFLLDGLHEDLNRVLQKPFVEKPDWEGGGNLELIQLANRSWEGYMRRNDSVIVDLFQGQYQSTLVCPECSKVSITFDPFMYLTLPLPVKKKWRHAIIYIPWDTEKPHLKIPIEIDSDATFRDVRILLGRWMNVPPDNLLTLEVFSSRFYKNLDDDVTVGDMADNDAIHCYELPCHAQQSKTYKPHPDDPLILPVYLCDTISVTRPTFINTRNPILFGTPMIVAIPQSEATDVENIYDEVILRIERWTRQANHLYTWEPTGISDIHQNGNAISLEEPNSEQSDITDQKAAIVEEDTAPPSDPSNTDPVKVGIKKDIFNLKLQSDHKHWGTSQYYSSTSKWKTWRRRLEEVGEDKPLLISNDTLYCEFDENMKTFYFGDLRSQWDNALFNHWEEFIHPEYEAARRSSLEKKQKGISLQDCLEEFTKEERLGEDDLWYCPRCKKHQQATKKFDLWTAPDILVVHLKRFSNSRTLRDKIDAFVDFPIEGLDLSEFVRERAVARELAQDGVDMLSLNLTKADEPLVYDLFGVDEHIGGLGGGHYRAYALSHLNGTWYHFDDTFVSPANATDAVNANAYLLFYRRRSETPLGGKTREIIEAARNKVKEEHSIIPDTSREEISMVVDTQLPTPPEEKGINLQFAPIQTIATYSDALIPLSRQSPTLDGPSLYDETQDELPDNPLSVSSSYDYPDLSNKTSPTSSTEALPDQDEENEGTWSILSINMPRRSLSIDSMRYDTPEGASSSTSLSSMQPLEDVNGDAEPKV